MNVPNEIEIEESEFTKKMRKWHENNVRRAARNQKAEEIFMWVTDKPIELFNFIKRVWS